MPSSNHEDVLSKPYIPIDTDVVDNIEHYSSDHIHVHIQYKDRDGSIKSMRGHIADVYTTKDHEEHLKMADGRTLRLDQLIQVDPTSPDPTVLKSKDRDKNVDLSFSDDIKESRFFPNGIS